MMPKTKRVWKFDDLMPEDKATILSQATEMVFPVVLKQVREERAAAEQNLKLWCYQPTENAKGAARRFNSYLNSTRRIGITSFVRGIIGTALKPFGIRVTPYFCKSPVHSQVKDGIMQPPAHYKENRHEA